MNGWPWKDIRGAKGAVAKQERDAVGLVDLNHIVFLALATKGEALLQGPLIDNATRFGREEDIGIDLFGRPQRTQNQTWVA